MDAETTHHIKELASDAKHYWQAIVLVSGVVLGWVAWYARQIFVTNKQLRAFIDENRSEHSEIKEDVHSIKEDISYMRGRMDDS